MATAAAERFGQQHPPRPGLESQHSSSVPSTPYQRPRDMRFHSRSPSPRRGLSNNSPGSVVSETVGPYPAKRAQNGEALCKFESGAELRKRRIPYVNDGNEELPPPVKEPKKTLDPDENKKLSGDMRELYDRLLPSDESEERRASLIKKLERILTDEWPGNDIRVNVFGSSGNLLSSSDSDVDICITTSYKKMESMHDLAALLARNGMEKVICRASAKVPIVKCWDPELRLACDLNVNNPMALENTRMIKMYVQLDPRVRPLAKIIKYWTKRRILNDAAFGGTISSYTWICMILSFLQRKTPPILPSLQKLDGHRTHPDSLFADDLESLRGCGEANKESLAELLFQFFRHYGYEFQYPEFVVSVKEGRLLPRKEKGWETTNYADKEAQKRLCVEEPFTIGRNLGNSADDYAWSGIHSEIRRAFDLLADGCQLEKCCEQYEFPVEEKPVFVRPAPKPAPVLRRSASQSGGRTNNHEQGSGRPHNNKKNRNQSAQRSGNRRASSGASFSNQRGLGVASPQNSANQLSDYFATKGSIHDQLFQQYQFLQAQQDLLRSQLAQHAQQQGQGQTPGQSNLGSAPPQHRGFTNGLSSPRYPENPPQSAPLLPGYLYHFPARFPPPSPMSQVRSRGEGTNTNPSSPSLVAAVPALRRQTHRASMTGGSPGSTRSQSQPGRSLPHPLTLHQQAHPGYDVSGAIPAQYQHLRPSQQLYSPGQPGMPLPFPSMGALHTTGSNDSAMPKEYVGYYVGQSPQLGPQPQYMVTNQISSTPLSLRDPPPQRQRRVTPDLAPPLTNGRHSSRSPSPLGNLRTFPFPERRATQPSILQSPTAMDAPMPMISTPAEIDIGGPLIVNGSNQSMTPKPVEKLNGVHPKLYDEHVNRVADASLSRARSLSIRTAELDKAIALARAEGRDKQGSPPRISPDSASRGKPASKVSMSPKGATQSVDHTHETSPLHAPLLSPVAEMRTPSPTRVAHPFEKLDSSLINGHLQPSKLGWMKRHDENAPPTASKHERKDSTPNPTMNGRQAESPTVPSPPVPQSAGASSQNGNGNANPWLQATAKRHKKAKSSSGSAKPSQGQPLPANESERKGG